MGALSAGLALPFSFSVQAAAGEGAWPKVAPESAVQASQESRDSALSRWRDYARATITPQFSWALPVSYRAPDVLDVYAEASVPEPLLKLQGAARARIDVSIATGTVGDTPSVLPSQSSQLVSLPQTGLQRTVVAPSLSSPLGEHGSLRLTGVLAYQRFASLGLGTAAASGWAPAPSWFGDSSYGAGARVDVGYALSPRLSLNVGYQSRVNMSAFSNYRGVFADVGDFDIPASTSFGLGYALTPHLGVDIGVQRVMYSAITPFASSSLPPRFLALLGDGSSPVFRWQDLDVYSIGWTVRSDRFGAMQLRYTTRQQPVPTSKLLARALDSATTNDMITLGWSRPIGTSTNVSFAANYATSPYYLLMPTYVARDNATASRFEFEAQWSTRF